MLRHEAHHTSKSLHGVLVGGSIIQGKVATEGFEQSGDTAQQGGLAATVRADNRGDFALRELES